MKGRLLSGFIFCVFTVLTISGQERKILRGQVLYRNNPVVSENVINVVTEELAVTDEGGRYAIEVKPGDRLVFSAVNYQMRVVEITQEILDNGRLVVEVKEKVEELQEVVLTPENQEKYIEVKNEEFKGFEYEIDRQSRVDNVALDRSVRGMEDGLNFVNIFKALFKSVKKDADGNEIELKMSDVLRQVYDDRFFVEDLGIPADKIDLFLESCDAEIPPRELIRKENEFQLIDFLVDHSKLFKEELKKQE